jgi:PilZ domain
MEDNRRGRTRFKVNVPLTVILGDRKIPAFTRDLSNQGVYFFVANADEALIDQEFEFLVELPPEITLSTWCQIRCTGCAVRREKAAGDLTGVAARILDYAVLKSA